MSLDGWKRASFLVGSESNVSNVKQWEPLPGGSVRPSGPCCFAVARAPFVSLDGWKRASFLVGSESNVRQWEPLPGGSVRPSGPCCFAQWEICPGVGGRGRSPLIYMFQAHRQAVTKKRSCLKLLQKHQQPTAASARTRAKRALDRTGKHYQHIHKMKVRWLETKTQGTSGSKASKVEEVFAETH